MSATNPCAIAGSLVPRPISLPVPGQVMVAPAVMPVVGQAYSMAANQLRKVTQTECPPPALGIATTASGSSLPVPVTLTLYITPAGVRAKRYGLVESAQ